MGIFKSGFSLILDMFFRIYDAQNYNVPKVKKLVDIGVM
ncbi:hypothetical protein LINPERPRIM_LOCUS35482 [Linum perenne]